MFQFRIRHIGVYRMADHLLYRSCSYDSLSLAISGIRHRFIDGMDLSGPLPAFLLAPRGHAIDVEFGPDRENWAVVFQEIHWRVSSDRATMEIADGKEWVRLPFTVPVPKEQVPGWRLELQRMEQALASPIPENRARAELGLANIFRFMLEHNVQSNGGGCAAQLRALIDHDNAFAQPLAQLSRQCGCSADHLRVLFEHAYGLSPSAYRQQRRVALALQLMSGTTLSVKEMAARLGFEHVSAFSGMFRRLTGQAPSEALRTYRG